MKGLRETGAEDLHILVCAAEVKQPTVERGPFGTVYLVPRPRLSGSDSLFLWRRRLLLDVPRSIQPDIVHARGIEAEYGLTAVTGSYPNVVCLQGIIARVHRIVPQPASSPAHACRWVERYVASRARDAIYRCTLQTEHICDRI